jgi:hypothetical protein
MNKLPCFDREYLLQRVGERSEVVIPGVGIVSTLEGVPSQDQLDALSRGERVDLTKLGAGERKDPGSKKKEPGEEPKFLGRPVSEFATLKDDEIEKLEGFKKPMLEKIRKALADLDAAKREAEGGGGNA